MNTCWCSSSNPPRSCSKNTFASIGKKKQQIRKVLCFGSFVAKNVRRICSFVSCCINQQILRGLSESSFFCCFFFFRFFCFPTIRKNKVSLLKKVKRLIIKGYKLNTRKKEKHCFKRQKRKKVVNFPKKI
jgi:hypothetical protein